MNDDYLRFNEEGLAEINPMASYNAQQEFIDNYRNAQTERTAQIGDQTHALGSDLTAQYGGLHGPSEYWLSRYQTPQTESRLAALRTSNQLQALNQLMQNDLAREAEKYNQAARAAQKRANSGNNGNTTDSNGGEKLGVSTFTNGVDQIQVSLDPNKGVAGKLQYDPETGVTSLLNADGSSTNLYNLTDAAEMRAQGWKLTNTFPNGTAMTDGATYIDPQTGFSYLIYNGRMYQTDKTAIPVSQENIVSNYTSGTRTGGGSW